MPSRLRYEARFEPFDAEVVETRLPSPPQKKQKMSLSQTYYIAASARSKLGKEACRPDHDLRLLVGHANLLDSLMLELADAEKEQEAWFNKTVKKAAKSDEPRHIQWADTIIEDPEEEDDDSSDSDSDSEYDEDAAEFELVVPPRRIRSPPVQISSTEVMDIDEEDDYEDPEFDMEHALVRTPSNSPPELIHDHDSDSEDDSPPTSPPQANFEISEKQRQAIATTAYYDEKTTTEQALLQDGYFLPERSQPIIAVQA